MAVLKLLLEAGADTEQAMSDGATPLFLAAESGNWAAVIKTMCIHD